MSLELFRIAGQIAGIGGLAIGTFLILFREIIRKKIFPNLARTQAYKLLRLMVILIWSLGLAGIASWVFVNAKQARDPLPFLRNDVPNEDTKESLAVDFAVLYEDESGTMRSVSEGATLKTGDGYQIYLRPNLDCHMYIFQVDSSNNMYRLYPNLKDTHPTSYTSGDEAIMLPEPSRVFELDQNIGIEKIYLVAAKFAILEFEKGTDLTEADLRIHNKDANPGAIMGIATTRKRKGSLKVGSRKMSLMMFEAGLERTRKEKAFLFEFRFNHEENLKE